MAKMSKKVKSLILAAIILVVLGGILTLLLLLPNDSDSADSSSAGATSSDASIVLIDKEQKNVKNINIKTQNESYDIASVGDKNGKSLHSKALTIGYDVYFGNYCRR